MVEERCGNCVNYSPHVYYPQVGRCLVFSTGVSESDSCDKFKRASIDELLNALGGEGSVYCTTCGATLVDEEELKAHSRNHRLAIRAVIDEAIAEEARAD
ncbi:MAG: hypothetical protein RMH84_02710 [Sulfolobales archaeon]|nr:hypothetical protein [Sulfolobales archaeon]MCX8208793.1 hypothetical protein [Sulfolobales archaeon]MDW8010487.1 hypothetical protein [Sulfolobales archaeon]